MEKILKSKAFVFLTPILNFVLFFVAGILLSYVPYVSGKTYGASGFSSGNTSTEYVFSIKNAIGVWLIGIAVSLLVLLVCVLIKKTMLKASDNK